MKFDNAFLTKDKNIGMQFTDHGETLTAYKDRKGVLHLTETATVTQKAAMAAIYWKRHNQYMPKKVH